MTTVAVFAGSKTPNDPAIMETAALLGQKLAQAGIEVTYGGGTLGVMGALASAALAAGGKVTAVILSQYEDEPQFEGASKLFASSEQDRFRILTSHNNPAALFAVPGGPGTMREVMQAVEAAVYEGKTGVVLVQVGDYLDGLKQTFDRSVAAGLIRPERADKLKLWPVTGDLAEVLPPPPPAIPGLYQGLGR
ncbi:MAG TPA: LOG family protein [Patescibacteria group bacterium]|nr:LOG family protein [Patescibacteria group bacterium]